MSLSLPIACAPHPRPDCRSSPQSHGLQGWGMRTPTLQWQLNPEGLQLLCCSHQDYLQRGDGATAVIVTNCQKRLCRRSTDRDWHELQPCLLMCIIKSQIA